MPHLKIIKFYQNKPKINLFLQKKLNCLSAGVFAPRLPMASGGWGRSSQTPETAPLLQISGYVPDTKCVMLILPSFRVLQREVIELAK